MMTDLKITSDSLSAGKVSEWISSPDAGGINIFIGTVRSETKGRKVQRLEFECYERMAIKEIRKIALYIEKEFSAIKILIHHRTGILFVNDIAVIIAVASPHRDSAFRACRYAIDTLKETVPIWKKEIFEDGEIWVSAHP